MEIQLREIPLREVLHFLGWRGTPVDAPLMAQLREACALVTREASPHLTYRRFAIEADGTLAGTAFAPQGSDVRAMLAPCREAVLLAATLGAQSERLLLRIQAMDAAKALLVDAALSAAVEAVLDAWEEELRGTLAAQRLYLTDRFSPGYGDMPIGQTKAICEVLGAQRAIGLTVSAGGVMMPRKSVTAVLGISAQPVSRRPSGCEGCAARETCALKRR